MKIGQQFSENAAIGLLPAWPWQVIHKEITKTVIEKY